MYLPVQRTYFQFITDYETSARIVHVRTNLRIVHLIMAIGGNVIWNKRNFNYSVFKVRNVFYIGMDLKIFTLWLLGIYSSISTFWKKCGVLLWVQLAINLSLWLLFVYYLFAWHVRGVLIRTAVHWRLVYINLINFIA